MKRGKWKSRIASLLVFVMTFLSAVNVTSFESSAAGLERYTVLVLDTSGATNFLDENHKVFYTADTAVEYVKLAAKKFVEDVQEANGTNYVAVVEYRGDTSNVISPFSTDMASLSSAIDELEPYNDTRGVARGLRTAEELIDGVTNPDAVKNVVLFTTGLTNIGEYDYDGIYDENTKASEWRNNKTQVRLYAYANAACAVAESLKEKATLYSVGIFKTMEDISLEGQELVDFFKLFASDLATSKGQFYELLDPNELEFAFGEVAEDITKLNDADGDGLPDIWETQGADTDGDGIIDLPLKLMGADPNVPDIFVEIDWMVQPEIKVGPFILRKETNLAPSKTAMRMVYESFRKEGINLHIDAGPDSVDYVTGNKWRDLSGGNEIPYNKHFDLGSGYVNWN